MAETAAEAPASVVMQGTPFSSAARADLVAVAARAAAERRVDDEVDAALFDQVDDVGRRPRSTLLTSIVGTPRLCRARAVPRVA